MIEEYLEGMIRTCADVGDMNAYFYYWCKLRELYQLTSFQPE